MRVILDRFEGDYAVCEKEDQKMIHIEKNKIPDHAKEGDVLLIHENKIIIDKEETLSRKKEIEKRMKDLWE